MKTDSTFKSDVLTTVVNQAMCCSDFLTKGFFFAMFLLFSSNFALAQTGSNDDGPLIIVKKGFYPGDGIVPEEVQAFLSEYGAQQLIGTQGDTEPTGTPPTIENCPADQTVECFGNVGHVASELDYTINCGPNGIIIIYEPPGILETGSCPGTEYVVTYDVWDQCGNNVTCDQIFTIDNPGPEITFCPEGGEIASADEAVSDVDALEFTFSCPEDPLCSDITVSVELEEMLDPCLGDMFIYTYTITDACGRSDECEQIFVIPPPELEIVCPSDSETVECTSDIMPSVDDVELNGLIDGIDYNVSFGDPTLVSGDENCSGAVYEVTVVVTDDCDREATCIISYTIENEGPTITAPEAVTIECAADAAADIDGVSFTTSCDLGGVVTADGPILLEGDGFCDGSLWKFVYTVTDDCDRTATAEQLVTISNEGPTITAPDAVTIECAADAAADIDGVSFTTSCDLGGVVTADGPILLEGDGFCDGSLWKFVYTVTDDCDRTATAEQLVTISNEGPTITAPDAVTIECAADAAADIDGVSFTTSCDLGGVVTADGPILLEGDGFCDGSLWKFVYTVTDDCDRTATAEQMVTISNEGPTITAPDAVTIECAADAAADIDGVSFTTSCDFGGVVTADGPILLEGDGFCDGSLWKFVYTVTDDCDRTATAEQMVTISNEGPTITAPDAVTIECAADAAADIDGVSFTTSCDFGGVVTADGPILLEGDGFCDGSLWKFVYTVTDDCDRTATAEQMVTISNEGPTITAPDAVTIECAADAAADIDGVTFTTSCDFGGVVTADGPILLEGNGFCDGSLWKFVYTVTDDCDRTASAEQLVTISNNGPSIMVPMNVTVDCGDSTDPTETGTATATDPCEGDLEVSFEDVIVSEACPQIIERTWSAMSDCEVVSGIQTITLIDEEAPVFDLGCQFDFDIFTSDGADCPADAGFSFAEGDEFPISEGYTIAGTDIPSLSGCVSDNCTADEDIIIRVATITETGDGCSKTFTVDFEALDECGNVGSGFSCNYNVIDDQAPELIMPEVTEAEVGCFDLSLEDATAFANGTLSPDEEAEFIESAAALFVELGLIPVGAQDDCNEAQVVEVSIEATIPEELCPTLVELTCTFVAIDDCENVSEEASTSISIIDNTPPVITCPENISVSCDQGVSTDVTGMATATDDCSDATVSYDDVVVSEGCPMVIERTFTATDACGLTSSCTQTITITYEDPTIMAPDSAVFECAADAVADIDGAVFTTACDLDGDVTADGPFLLEGNGVCDGSVWEFVYTVTDACGRTASDSQIVTIENDGPTIVAPENVESQCIDFYVPNPEDAVVTTACDLGFDIEVSDPVLIEGQASCNLSVYEITYTVTDECGRSASDIQILTSVNGGLEVLEEPEDLTVTCYEDIQPDPWAIEYFSPCSSDVFIQVTPPTQLCCTEDCPGAEYSIIYTITNDCGDEVVVEQLFVIDNEGPTIISCGDDEMVESVDDIVVSIDDVDYETACGVECDVTVVSEPEIVDNGCGGVDYVYTYTITDNCGRTATCDRTFTVPSDDPTCNLDDDCDSFTTFYADINGNQTTLYSVDFTASEALLTYETDVDFSAHIAFDAVNSVVYLVNDNGSSLLAYDPSTDTELFELTIGGNINQLFAVVYNPMDELIYVGDANDDEIYTIDPLGFGDIDFFANGPVEGGDLAIQDGTLYLVNRGNSNLYTVAADDDGVSDGISDATLVGTTGSPEISGMAPANNTTSFILSNGTTTNFTKVNATDASTENVYMAMLDGEIFELASGGDMAAGCANNFGSAPCSYTLYYTHNPEGTTSYSLLEVELDELGNATYTTLLEDLGSSHIGLSNDGSEIYMVGGSNVLTYDVASGLITNDVNIFNGANDANLSSFPAAVVGPDNQLFIAGAGNNVWLCDPESGEATNIASGISVNGGDLIFAPTGEEGAEELWIITRNNATFTRVLDPGNGSFSVDVSEINGAAVLENGNVLLADGDGNSLLKEVSLTSQEVEATYDIGLPLLNGDLAGGCTGETQVVAVVNLPNSVAFPSNVYPNPSVNSAVISFEPVENARTQVELFDMSGRPMQSLFNAEVKSGLEYRVNVNTSAFEDGIYIYRITNGSHQVTKKLMIVD